MISGGLGDWLESGADFLDGGLLMLASVVLWGVMHEHFTCEV
jgi:hypothetical protein